MNESSRTTTSCLALATAIAIGVGAGSAHAADQKINYVMPNIATSQSFAFIADGMGFWKRQGSDVDMSVVAGRGSSDAVLGGDAQFATSTGAAMLPAVAHGQPMIAIADIYRELVLELDLSKEAAQKTGLTVANSTVAQRAKALKGMTIAIDAPFTVVDAFLRHIEILGGLNPDKDVTTSPMAPPAVNPAMDSKRVDGFAMNPPWTSLPESKGTGVIWISGLRQDLPDMSPFAYSGIIARVDYCQKNGDICKKFLKGVLESIQYMITNPDDGFKYVTPHFKYMDPALLKKDYLNQIKLLSPDGTFTEAAWKNTQNLDVSAGILTPAEAREKFEGALYTNAYLK